MAGIESADSVNTRCSQASINCANAWNPAGGPDRAKSEEENTENFPDPVIGQLLRSMETGKTENPRPEPSGSHTKLALLMDGVESRYVTTAHVAGCPSQECMCRKSLGLSIETRRNKRAGINRVKRPVND